MHSSLLALIELAAGDNLDEDLSVEEQYPELVAPIMRYEMLLKNLTDDTIKQVITGMTKTDLIQGKAAFDKGYFLSMPLPYSGIQQLCQELLKLCKEMAVEPTTIWKDYADGVFPWVEDIDYMSSL